MAPTPRSSEKQARIIRALSEELRHSPRATPSPSPVPADSNPTLNFQPSSFHDFTATSSNFDPENEALMSTRQMDENTLPAYPNLRSSAQRYAYYNPPHAEARITTSAVKKEFHDFDQEMPYDEEESDSVELGRGVKRSARNTPSKPDRSDMSPNVLFSSFHDSLYDVTPPSRPRLPARKTNLADASSLRRDAQIRRASSLPAKEAEASLSRLGKTNERVSPNKPERRRSTLAQVHARISTEEDDSLIDERPPTTTLTVKNTRFGTSRSRQSSGNQETQTDYRATPPRAAIGTPRSAQVPGSTTQQSFMLPDLPNLTELVSGIYKDGTPVFSRSMKARSRFASSTYPSRGSNNLPNYVPVESVAPAPEEKAIYTSLQLLKEKVAQLEQEKAESEHRIDEQDNEIISLKAELDAQDKLRRSDSGLGSTDGEGGKGRSGWKQEKSRLETSVATLRSQLDRAERKVSVAEIATKRITTERDNLVTRVGEAFYNLEEVKAEKEAFQKENESLRQEVDELRAENDKLVTENEDLRVQLAQFQEETQQLRKRSDRKESAVQQENVTLHAELARLQAQKDEDTRSWARKEAQVRRDAARKAKQEYAELKSQNDELKAQIADANAQLELENIRWRTTAAELRSQLKDKEETIREFEDFTQNLVTQNQTNGTLEQENQELRRRLNALIARHEDENSEHTREEARLRSRIERRQDASSRNIPRNVPTQAETVRSKANLGAVKKNTSSDRLDAYLDEEDVRQRLSKESMSRTKSKSNRLSGSRFTRSASAPTPNIMEDREDLISDAESTTDLSLHPVPRRGNTYNYSVAGNADNVTLGTADMDLTELSVPLVDVSAVRRKLEEERMANRKGAIAASARQARDDTVRSAVSTKSLRRKSSMKDTTARSQNIMTGDLTDHDAPTDEEQEVGRTQTQKSTRRSLSQSSRRRRSAPVEMTSAFIVPDITIHTRNVADLTTNDIPRHESKNCTICRRTAFGNDATGTVKVPALVPVSDRIMDPDATMRPAQDPGHALAVVIKSITDELAHLQLEYEAQNALWASLDASAERRKHTDAEAKIKALLEQIAAKKAQLYRLYDVLEGQKEAGQLSQEQVDATLEEVGVDPAEFKEARKAKGKRVVIEESEGENASSAEETEWNGCENTTQSLTAALRRL